MALPSLALQETGSGYYKYCRKHKSLGFLCSNFLRLYNRDVVETIGLDDAASKLGVERRQIYAIVKVLESVGVLVKKAKTRYYWKGFGAIPRALQKLKEESLTENYDVSVINSYTEETEKKNSLGLLTQNSVKLFLCSHVDMISLDEAAKILLGDDLFAHYEEAWKSWYFEVVGKNPTPLVS